MYCDSDKESCHVLIEELVTPVAVIQKLLSV
jgi:hypothetical protein